MAAPIRNQKLSEESKPGMMGKGRFRFRKRSR